LKSPATSGRGFPLAGNGEPGAFAKPPRPSPCRTATSSLLPLKFAIARSTLPSPSKSPAAIESGSPGIAGDEFGPPGTAKGEPCAGAKPPAPSPSSTLTLSLPWFAIARSVFPSRLRSTATAEAGSSPVGNGDPAAS